MPRYPRPEIAIILLAAGQSSRFGAEKLSANLDGKAVVEHCAAHLASLQCGHLLAVCKAPMPALSAMGYDIELLSPPHAPLSRSIEIGVNAAQSAGAKAVLMMLADMPLVPLSHFEALLDRFDGDRIASLNGVTTMPPAIFGAQHFAALMALTGDRGAGALLLGAPYIPFCENAAIDIDTQEDLAKAQHLLSAGQSLR